MNIALIGAGLSALTFTRYLSSFTTLTLFEKSRGVGGRMATKRHGSFSFDHGAQYFTVKSAAFQDFIQLPDVKPHIKKWDIPIHKIAHDHKLQQIDEKRTLFVGSPAMTALPKALSYQLDIHKSVEIIKIKGQAHQWYLYDQLGSEYGPFDWVISTAPAPQSAKIIPDICSFYHDLQEVQMAGCFSLMLGFEKKLPLRFKAAFCEASPLGWIACNHLKPNIPNTTSLVFQSTKEWAEKNMEGDKETIQKKLLKEACEKSGLDLTDYTHSDIHRWRYASVIKAAQKDFLIDAKQGLAACGDWCIKGRIEAAFESGRKLALTLNKYSA